MESRLYKIVLLFYLFYSPVLLSRETRDFVYYNQATYDHYLREEWDQLIKVAHEALNSGYDFYYLRARLGIAFYEKGIYTSAIIHFKKALIFNSTEPAMLEYLYYAYILASRHPDAAYLFHNHQEIFGNIRLDYQPKFIDGLGFEGTYKWSNHMTEEGVEIGNVLYGRIGFQHNLGGRLNLIHFAGLLSMAITDKYYDENYYICYPYHFYQFDYYAKLNLLLGTGWVVSPAFHFTGVDAVSSHYADIYFGLGIRKRLGRISIGFNYGYADIYDKTIKQYVPEIVYYPLGNNKLYLTGTAIFSTGDADQQVYMGSAGVRVFPVTWIEGFFAGGKSQYVSLFEGALIYNNPDYLQSRTGCSLTQYLNSKTSLQFFYVAEKKEQTVSGDHYTQHVFSLGLNLKF
ncbi:MAG: hypothetical protein KFF73_18860 [Cyclobacteriaceae bacterium]|nr:hypothetical protein [Cyclobacteriaceae bacterium]